MNKSTLRRGLLMTLLSLLFFASKVVAGEPVAHIMICCKQCNRGVEFLVNGQWKSNHDYGDINQARDILQKMKDAGIHTVSIDMTNSAQWENLWSSSLTQINNIQQVCREKNMQFFIFIGAQLSQADMNQYGVNNATTYWNRKAGIILSTWAGDPTYRKYGYGDNRPILLVFLPGQSYRAVYDNAPEKNNIAQFHVGTTQVNDPITPQTSDGWGYRNTSGNPEGTVRFVSPNGGVSPDQFYKVSPQEWSNRVAWGKQASQYSVYGGYDDTCDGIQWGIARTANSSVAYNVYPGNGSDPYVYYNIIKNLLTSPNPPQGQTPYAGVIQLPGVVEAENFDKGGEGVAYHDSEAANLGGEYRPGEGVDIQSCTEGGYNVGWTAAGEWLEYSINVASAGTYQVGARVASPNAGRLHYELDGQPLGTAVALPATGGFQTWQTVTTTLTLPAGAHVLRVAVEAGGVNLNRFTFSATGAGLVAGQLYRLTARHSGQVLDLSKCSPADGAKVQQYRWLDNACQRWRLEATDGGYYKLRSQSSGLVLEVNAAGVQDGDRVQQWTDNSGDWQQWRIEAVAGGYYKLTNRRSGRVLEVGGVSQEPEAGVQQWNYLAGGNQQWLLDPVGPAPAAARTALATTTAANARAAGDETPSLQVFPNPASDQVTVTVPVLRGAARLTIHNALGQLVQERAVESAGSVELNTAGLAPGIYILSLHGNGLYLHQRLVLE